MTRRPIILAVDDTPGNLVALEAVLDREFDVRTARTGAEAIAMLQRHPDVDVICMDVNMPVMDGYEAASRITRIPGCSDIPIVFITATYKEDPYIKRGYEVGGIDYFTKPFDPDLLRKKMGVYASFRQRAAVLAERERQVRAAQELLATTQRLSATLERTTVGVVIVDLDGKPIQASDAVTTILGAAWSDAEVVENDRQAIARALQHGESTNGVARVRHFDGVSREIQSCVSPLRDAAGVIVGAVITLRDLTEPNRLERELETRSAHLLA